MKFIYFLIYVIVHLVFISCYIERGVWGIVKNIEEQDAVEEQDALQVSAPNPHPSPAHAKRPLGSFLIY